MTDQQDTKFEPPAILAFIIDMPLHLGIPDERYDVEAIYKEVAGVKP